MRFALRDVADGNAFSLRSNRTLVDASRPSRKGGMCSKGVINE